MIEAGRSEGIETIGLYGLVYFGGGDYYIHRDTNNALVLAEQYGIRPVWMDAEIDATGIGVGGAVEPSPAQRNAELAAVRTKILNQGAIPGVYTAEGWWRYAHANTTQFSSDPLWYANYGSNNPNAPRSPISVVSFGGWSAVDIHQYSSTIVKAGRERDHNYLYKLEDDELNEADRKMLDMLSRVVAGWGITVVVTEENKKFLEQVGVTNAAVGDTVSLSGANAVTYLDLMNTSLYAGLIGLNEAVTNLPEADTGTMWFEKDVTLKGKITFE